jgi:hypothetical protein
MPSAKRLHGPYGHLYADGKALGIALPIFLFVCKFVVLTAANTQKYI